VAGGGWRKLWIIEESNRVRKDSLDLAKFTKRTPQFANEALASVNQTQNKNTSS
jgi:hypothetical protein